MSTFLLDCAFLLILVMVEVQGMKESHKPQGNHVKLFVFGDSNVDTGNGLKLFSRSWRQPYGMTYPGKPGGRFSDGHILIDYIAQFFNITSPVPYVRRNSMVKSIQHGMNFAYGGIGKFDVLDPVQSTSTQIHYLQQLLKQKVYTKTDLKSSIALMSLTRAIGDEYGFHLTEKGNIKETIIVSEVLMKKLILNLQRIHDLGVRKIVVVGMESLGCLPQFTAPSFLECNTNLDRAALAYNMALQSAVQKLRKKNKRSVFVILDLYSAFKSALNRTGNSLKPCCLGEGEELMKKRPTHRMGEGNSCGSVDKKGEKKYTVCKDPNSSFFWDNAHPAQHGWFAIYSVLQSSLGQLY